MSSSRERTRERELTKDHSHFPPPSSFEGSESPSSRSFFQRLVASLPDPLTPREGCSGKLSQKTGLVFVGLSKGVVFGGETSDGGEEGGKDLDLGLELGDLGCEELHGEGGW